MIYLVPRAFLRIGENGREKTLASADRRIFKHPEKLAVINSFSLFNRCGGAVAVRAMTGISGKNAMNADRSLNSLTNPSSLVKCYFITPNFSGFLKSAGSFPIRLLLGGERPLEQGSNFRCKKITFDV